MRDLDGTLWEGMGSGFGPADRRKMIARMAAEMSRRPKRSVLSTWSDGLGNVARSLGGVINRNRKSILVGGTILAGIACVAASAGTAAGACAWGMTAVLAGQTANSAACRGIGPGGARADWSGFAFDSALNAATSYLAKLPSLSVPTGALSETYGTAGAATISGHGAAVNSSMALATTC
jgi:hypothetical protein